MKKKIYCFDIDGVICKTNGNNYDKSKPNTKAIKIINKLFEQDNTIKIFTARHMTKFKGNIKKVNKFGFKKTKKQLEKWNVKFHKLIMGKPSYDIIVDDKSLGFKRNWIKNLDKLIKNQLKNN